MITTGTGGTSYCMMAPANTAPSTTVSLNNLRLFFFIIYWYSANKAYRITPTTWHLSCVKYSLLMHELNCLCRTSCHNNRLSFYALQRAVRVTYSSWIALTAVYLWMQTGHRAWLCNFNMWGPRLYAMAIKSVLCNQGLSGVWGRGWKESHASPRILPCSQMSEWVSEQGL